MSTDSDLIVHSYPDMFIDVFRDHNYMVDTKKLFDTLQCTDPAVLCTNLKCDYN